MTILSNNLVPSNRGEKRNSFVRACAALERAGLQIELVRIQGLPVWAIRVGGNGNS